MRPPMWRWSRIVSTGPDGPVKGEDQWIGRGWRFDRDYRKGASGTELDRKYPGCRAALEAFSDSRPGGWKWMLEALLMSSSSDRDLADLIGDRKAGKAVTAYRKLFFDIDEYRDSPMAVSVNVLASAGNRAGVMGTSDYVWKLFSYTWGAEEFMNAVCRGPETGSMTDKQQKWMAAAIRQENMFRAMNAVEELKAGWSEQAAMTLDSTRHLWSHQGETGGESLFDRYLDELMSLRVAGVIQGRKDTEPEKLEAEEKRSGINRCDSTLVG